MIGFGYDIHRLERDKTLVLGGITIPWEKGTVAHSDGDAALHAVCDALLGAAMLGDIGTHFPDSSPEFAGISSLELLRRVVGLVREKNYTLINIDVTIVLERPKIAQYIPRMRDAIEPIINTTSNPATTASTYISIKATTNEGLGGVGAGDAVAAFAVAQIERMDRTK